MNITTDNTQTILNLQAELESLRAQLAAQPTPSPSELEITASNNFLAMEIVTNYLIEIDALITPHEGEGEAAGLNIVESIKKHIASVKAQPTSQDAADAERYRWLRIGGNPQIDLITYTHESNLDEAIDAAMKESK